MPNPSQYTFTLKEVAEILAREAGLSEGKWLVGVNFGIQTVTMGPSKTQAFPTLLASVESVNLAQQPEDVEMTSIVVDASKLKHK